jgi:hypothetical protein
MTIDSNSPVHRPFLQRNWLPITFGILLLAILGAAMTLFKQQAVQEPFQSYLDQVAAASPAANSTLQAYYAQVRRENVASQDFLPLCSTMTKQAEGQSVNVDSISRNIASGCRSFSRSLSP